MARIPGRKPATLAEARSACAAARRALDGKREVSGVGVARLGDGYGVKVNLTTPCDGVPDEVEGVPVVAEVVGPVRKR